MQIFLYASTPSAGATQSHPIVHLSHKDGAVLPAAAVEEEVRETPMRNSPSPVRSKPPPYSSSAEWPKHLPHLAYEITSQDGFSCRGDTMDGGDGVDSSVNVVWGVRVLDVPA